jgi:hypothetical protein
MARNLSCGPSPPDPTPELTQSLSDGRHSRSHAPHVKSLTGGRMMAVARKHPLLSPGFGKVWVVFLQVADPGAPLQELSGVAEAAEDPVGGGSKGQWQEEESVQDLRPVCGRAVYPGDLEFPAGDKSGTESGRG